MLRTAAVARTSACHRDPSESAQICRRNNMKKGKATIGFHVWRNGSSTGNAE